MALTEQQRKYAEARMGGLDKRDAAIAAGCPLKTASAAGSRLEKHPSVLAHLARLKGHESDEIVGAGRDAPPVPKNGSSAKFFDDPKELLRDVMNNPALDVKMRVQAAVALLPFEHQKMGDTGKKEQREQAAEQVVTGRFAPSPPPTQLKLVQ